MIMQRVSSRVTEEEPRMMVKTPYLTYMINMSFWTAKIFKFKSGKYFEKHFISLFPIRSHPENF